MKAALQHLLGRVARYFHKHKPIQDDVLKIGNGFCTAHCASCGRKLLGAYVQGEHSREWFWVYVEAASGKP